MSIDPFPHALTRHYNCIETYYDLTRIHRDRSIRLISVLRSDGWHLKDLTDAKCIHNSQASMYIGNSERRHCFRACQQSSRTLPTSILPTIYGRNAGWDRKKRFAYIRENVISGKGIVQYYTLAFVTTKTLDTCFMKESM